MSNTLKPRDIKDGPFCWCAKPALWRIRDGLDGKSSACAYLAVYLAHCEIASDRQIPTYTVPIVTIAGKSGVSTRHVKRIHAFFKDLELLSWTQNHIPNSRQLGPSTYTLLRIAPRQDCQSPPSDTQSPRGDTDEFTQVGTDTEQSCEEFQESPEERNGNGIPAPSHRKL